MPAPAILLIEPQMGENIGAAARAMLNCGLTDLRLVRPRDGWPNERADAMSSGALDQMPDVQVFDTTQEALADVQYSYATTARRRDMAKPVLTARSAAEDIHARTNQKTAFLFGPERAGLGNEDVALANAIITIPVNPSFPSLNLGQGVLLCAYEWFQAQDQTPALLQENDPAPHAELDNLFDRLEDELDAHHFFKSADIKPTVLRNLKNTFGRAEMSHQEVQTFHGILSALTGKKSIGEKGK
ncbi:MAG: RNA methyltransferase [Rhodospirillales bacterium]|nr:RNA methyltransferase [Alphaproteobacteria bacterium]USO03078.1 MAG: RNA methyltransferase [Rhodospirillales bacterium]